MVQIGDVIKFKRNPKLNERHDYKVTELVEDRVAYQNTKTGRVFSSTITELKLYGVYVSQKAEGHPNAVKNSSALSPRITVNCKHTKTELRKFATFQFRQCLNCKADLGEK